MHKTTAVMKYRHFKCTNMFNFWFLVKLMRALGLRPASVDVNNQNCKTMKMYEYILNEKNTHFNTIIYKQKPFKIAVTVKVNLSNI